MPSSRFLFTLPALGFPATSLTLKGFLVRILTFNDGDSVVNVEESASSTHVPSHAMDIEVSVPFALVHEIADASPAAEDGIQFGDQFLKFGNVKNGDNLLRKIASGAQMNQGCAVHVMVLRQGARFDIMVTPRTWQGRGGLLGCHFRIL
ncbi:hypothetical protein ACLB2K_032217 [Fragaria x ananassa]